MDATRQELYDLLKNRPVVEDDETDRDNYITIVQDWLGIEWAR